MDIYSLTRDFWNWSFENPELIKPNHTAVYFFAIEHCNRLGWKKKFGFPTTMAMDAVGIKSYNTFIKTLNELVDFGFITLIEKSKNQYSANIIALSKNDKAFDKALDKAMIKHTTKQSESTIQSTVQSNDSIDIPIYNNTSIQVYGKSEFLNDWNEMRTEHLKKPSHLNSLSFEDLNNLKELSKDYNRENFRNALEGLFRQKKLPNDMASMQSNPKHFLTHFNSYLTAYHDRSESLYGKKEKELI